MTGRYEQPSQAMNRSMVSSVVIPELVYPDVRAAVDWLCRAFGFVERLQIGTHRAQLLFGEGAVIVKEPPNQSTTESSGADGLLDAGLSHSVMVRVANVDHHFEHARQSGAQIVSPPTDYPYGERQYSVYDLGGHRWTFSQTIADIDPRDWGGTLVEQA